MTANDACPTDSTLRELVSDRLAPEICDRLTDHIGQCESCQGKLRKMEKAPDIAARLPMLKKVREDSPDLNDAIKRAKSLGHPSPESDAAAIAPSGDEDQADPTAFTRDGFERLGMLGRGGMGIVYKAREASLDRLVAVKVLSPMLAGDALSRERFLREARAAAKVVHPNVVTIHAVSEKTPAPYLVMEYVEGVSLQQQLDSGVGISIDNVVRIGRQISAGLSAAHGKGVVHRDIKPGNILLNSQTGKVLVGDFGLARVGDRSRITRTGTLVGTPAYVAPEVLENADSADHRADLFSLGVVLYAICSGDSPFQTDSLLGTLHRLSAWQPEPLAKKVPDVPAWLSQIVMRLLEKNPSERFQSAAEVRDALGREPNDSTATTPNPSVAEEPTRPDLPPHPSINVDTTSKPGVGIARRRSKRKAMSVWLVTGIAVSAVLVGLIAVVGSGSGDTGPPGSDREFGGETRRIDRTSRNRSPDGAISEDPGWQETPFVCTSLNGNDTERFASLDEAIEHLPSGGQIEIQVSGVIETPACDLVWTEPISLSAGPGFQPVLWFAPDEDDEDTELEPMLRVESDVTLTGIELRLPKGLAGEDEGVLIGVEETGDLKLVDCTLVVEGGGFCIFSQATITMENCQLHAPESVALTIAPQEEAQTVLRNCWVSGEAAFEVFAHEDHEITLRDSTFACSQVLGIDNQDEETPGLLSVNARRSLFRCDEPPIVVEEDSEEDDPPIEWTGKDNVYSGRLMADVEGDDANDQGGMSEFERWQQSVEETGSSYVANPFNIAPDELRELISNADFRLSKLAKSKTVSAGAKQD